MWGNAVLFVLVVRTQETTAMPIPNELILARLSYIVGKKRNM